jgi:AP-2 complex subunit alpha
VDIILQLIEKAGEFVGDDIWYRVVQFVTNNDDLQVMSASTFWENLSIFY